MEMDHTAFTVVFATAAVAVFLITALAEYIMIPILRSHKLGQKILDIGPRWHKSKEGTPIMGGIGFILASMIVMAIFFVVMGVRGEAADYIPLALTLAFAVANGAIGFVDDYCKLIKHDNEGLTRLQKMILQIVVSAAYVALMSYMGFWTTAVTVPFTEITFDLGWAFYPIVVIALFAVINGANFTDGIDGLCSSVTCVIGIFFSVVAFVTWDTSLSLIGALLIGSTLGFLIYNFHPARVFMGDTGSLFFGALVIGAALNAGMSMVALVVTLLYLIELASSGIQIAYSALTHGKRFFKMAPIHHHFERCGWGEIKIVVVFSIVQALFCILAWFAL